MTIIFDGNYLMMRALFSCNITNNSRHVKLQGYEDRQKLATKVLFDISSTIELFRSVITNVKVVFDKGSWRKERTAKYKENREEGKSTIDFSGFDEVREELSTFLNNLNIQTISIYQAEGDDLVKLLIDAVDSDILIFSADSDLFQLLQYNENRKVLQFSPLKNYLYVTKGFNDSLTKEEFTFEDIINESSALEDSKKFESILQKVTVKEYIPTLELLSKIIRGDKSDGLESIQKGIGAKKAEAIFRSLDDEREFSRDICDWDFILDQQLPYTLVNEIQQIVKIKNEDIIERIEHNRELIALHEQFIPEVIMEEFNDLEISKDNIDIHYLCDFDQITNDCDYIYTTSRAIHFPMFGSDL